MSAQRRAPPPPPPPPPGPPPTRRNCQNGGSNHNSNQSISSVPSIISSGSISNGQSGNNTGTGSFGVRRRGTARDTATPSTMKKFSVPAGTPNDDSFTEIHRQKSNENLMEAMENEMDMRAGLPQRSTLGLAHPARRRHSRSSPPVGAPQDGPPVVAAPTAIRSSSGRPMRRNSRDEILLTRSRHNSQDEILLPEYDDYDEEASNDGLSLEDHVKLLQKELDAATFESGEMYDHRRRKEDRLTANAGRCQDTTVSALSIDDMVDGFDVEREIAIRKQQQQEQQQHQQQQRAGGGGGIGGGRRSHPQRGSPSSGGSSRSISTNNAVSKLKSTAAISISEMLIMLVVVAALSFGSGHFLSAWLHPFNLDIDSCTPSPQRIQESATYQHLLTKYESARKEISSLRIQHMDAKESHYMETTTKAKELLKKADENTEIAQKHMDNVKTTMELQKQLTEVERMYNAKIIQLEKQVKETEEKAMVAANPMSDSVRARDAQWKKHDLAMMSKIAQNSHRAVLGRYGGGGPFRVEFVLEFPGEQVHAVGNRIIVETAPIGMMPHAVHMFLEMAAEGLYTGTRFNFAGPNAVSLKIEEDDEAENLKKKFKDYTPALSFPEYNDHFPHKEYTLGFFGRDPRELPGPSFFINTRDNTAKNGPQPGQYDEHGFEVGAFTCFAKVISGKNAVDRMSARARYGVHAGQGKMMKPVEIVNTFVHMI